MAKKAKAQENFLDFIPLKNPTLHWVEQEGGLVSVTITHTGIYDKIAQKFFHTPAESTIDLDIYGSFVWKQIDGERSVFAISELVKERFGADAEPLLNRLVAFFGTLKNNAFILWKGARK